LKFIEPNMKTIITPNHKIRLYIETEKQEAKKSSVPNQLIFLYEFYFLLNFLEETHKTGT
jgi:hypothetical protein